MITLKFIVNKDFILQHVLKHYSEHLPFIKLKRKVWGINKNLYQVLSQNLEPLIFDDGLAKGLPNAVLNLKSNLSVIYQTAEFKKIFYEAERYSNTIKKQWIANYNISLFHLAAITKIDLSKINKEIKVYVSHPKLWRGRTYVENNAIAWSHPDEWKNYATVYLWHEIMHHITSRIPVAPHLMHALIELSCDNELRIRLNGSKKYFEENGILMGHKYLVGLNRKLLPDWKKYLKNPNENIFQFEKKMRKKHHREELLKPRSRIIEWNEWH